MTRYYCALVVSCIGIAAAPLLVRVSEVDPPTTLWLRMLLASVILFSMPQWRRPACGGPLSARTVCCLAAASAVFAFDLLSHHLAVVRTSVANTALLSNIAPIIVVPAAYILYGESQTTRAIAGLGGAFLGATLLVGAGELRVDHNTSIVGDTLAITSGSLYALYMLLCRQLARQVGSAQIMLCNCVVTAVILIPVVAHSGAIDLPHSITGWLIIAGMAVGCQIFGHGLLVYALVEIPASFASIAILASPVISALSAWMLFGEVVTLRQFAGSALVVVGLGAASLSEVQRTAGSQAANATSRLR